MRAAIRKLLCEFSHKVSEPFPVEHISAGVDVSSDAAIAASLAAMDREAAEAQRARYPLRGQVPNMPPTIEDQNIREIPVTAPARIDDVSSDAAIAASLQAVDREAAEAQREHYRPSGPLPSTPPTIEYQQMGQIPVTTPTRIEDVSNDAAIAASLAAMDREDAIPVTTSARTGVHVRQAAPTSSPNSPDEVCVACLDLQANTCIIPCGHVCICVSCASKLTHPRTCPMCRMRIEGIVQRA